MEGVLRREGWVPMGWTYLTGASRAFGELRLTRRTCLAWSFSGIDRRAANGSSSMGRRSGRLRPVPPTQGALLTAWSCSSRAPPSPTPPEISASPRTTSSKRWPCCSGRPRPTSGRCPARRRPGSRRSRKCPRAPRQGRPETPMGGSTCAHRAGNLGEDGLINGAVELDLDIVNA